ncbi:MAG TPA: hypothetical protein VMV33_14440 [Rhodocyclaceae bacterium]|nr:hypothetical protein [Rhodocyclaceae bacterium]
MARLGSEATRSKWRGIVAAQAASGQTVAGFCRERGLCAPHFFWWKKRLAAAAFVEIKLATPDAGALELRLAGGRSLWLRAGFDPELLRQVLAALEERG